MINALSTHECVWQTSGGPWFVSGALCTLWGQYFKHTQGYPGGGKKHYWRCHIGQNTRGIGGVTLEEWGLWRYVPRRDENVTRRGGFISVAQERILSTPQGGKIWWDVCISICASCLNMPHRATTHSRMQQCSAAGLSAECNKAYKNWFAVKDQDACVRCFHMNPGMVSQVNSVITLQLLRQKKGKIIFRL